MRRDALVLCLPGGAVVAVAGVLHAQPDAKEVVLRAGVAELQEGVPVVLHLPAGGGEPEELRGAAQAEVLLVHLLLIADEAHPAAVHPLHHLQQVLQEHHRDRQAGLPQQQGLQPAAQHLPVQLVHRPHQPRKRPLQVRVPHRPPPRLRLRTAPAQQAGSDRPHRPLPPTHRLEVHLQGRNAHPDPQVRVRHVPQLPAERLQAPLEQHRAEHNLADKPVQLAEHLLPLQVQTHRHAAGTALVPAQLQVPAKRQDQLPVHPGRDQTGDDAQEPEAHLHLRVQPHL